MREYQNARRISVYLSMPSGEICTQHIVEDALRQGKEVFVPYLYEQTLLGMDKPSSVMDMVSLDSQDDYDSLKQDKWGIPTPCHDSVSKRLHCLQDKDILHSSQTAEGADCKELDMILLPGVAFDSTLGRLGHGKGYYDFFLHRYYRSANKNQSINALPKNSKMPYLGKSRHLAFCIENTANQSASSRLSA